MPYIDQKSRLKFREDTMLVTKETAVEFLGKRINTAGELNYVVSMLCLEYLKTNGKNYQHMNDIMGALQGVQSELYRRVIAPYEDEKINSNGDIL